MNDLITQLRQIEGIDFNPPCTTEQVDYLAAELNLAALPDDLRALYLDHDGMAFGAALPMRLMSHHEVMRVYKQTRTTIRSEVRLFWCDDYSNYAGLFFSGELAGKVAIADVNNSYNAPHFQSITSFYKGLLQISTLIEPGWWNIPRDYPLR